MTTERTTCPAPEELPAVLAAAPGDPRRRHVAACPRCRSLAAAYRAFAAAEPADVPAGDLARLDRWIAERTAPPRPERRRVRWPVPAGLLAAAALLLLLARPASRSPAPDRLRGRPPAGPAITGCRLVTPAEGPPRLVWQRPVGVDSCVVILFAADLTACDTLVAGPRDVVELPPDGAAYWRVLGYREGDGVAASALVPLE